MKNKTALITGASSGIGLEIAGILSDRKYDLILVSRSEEKLKKIAKEIHNQNKINIIPLDLSKPENALLLYHKVQELNLNVDLLINSAGIGQLDDFTESNPETLQTMLELNIVSLTMLCRYFSKDMKTQGRGYIMNIASTAAYQPMPYFASYAATKSYVRNFSISLHHELKHYNVHVICLSPGPTDTNFFVRAEKDTSKGIMNRSNFMNANKVAEEGLDAMFNHKSEYIPGAMNITGKYLSKITPTSLLEKIMRKEK